MFYLIKLNPKPNIFTYNTIKNKFNYLKCKNFKKKMYTKVMVEPKLGISKIRKTKLQKKKRKSKLQFIFYNIKKYTILL